MSDKNQDKNKQIVLERNIPEGRLLPKDFFDVIVNRYLPVLSFTYLSTLIGIALKRGGITQILCNGGVYDVALMVSLWVSVPAVIWILVNGLSAYRSYADLWYKLIAGAMVMVLLLSFMIFPMGGNGILGAIRIFIVAALPIHFVMYFFFIKGGMPTLYSVPISAVGLTFLIYGHFLI